ncbi:MAG: hypothetical protein JRE38_00405 [Deltaproteobacteria bacterium]|nr:hypothetical protein [Deltaproteobacteria bacterium]
MFHLLARVSKQCLREIQVLGTREEVPLIDGAARRGDDGGFEQVGVAVSETVDADSRDEVDPGGPVCESNARAAAGPAAHRPVEERLPAQSFDLAQGALVGLWRERTFVDFFCHRR